MATDAHDRAKGISPLESQTPPFLQVEVAYATPARQRIVKIRVPQGTTAAQAIEVSGIARDFPEALSRPGVGIFGRRVAEDYVLKEGDRVEIYRPLLVDPKEARRRNARKEPK